MSASEAIEEERGREELSSLGYIVIMHEVLVCVK